jgi:hypothetical protein
LQAGDEVICFAGSFDEIFDLNVFDADLGAKKNYLSVFFRESPFKLINILLVAHVRLRLSANGCLAMFLPRCRYLGGQNGRVRSRLVANGRLADIDNLGDVSGN